MFCSQCGKPLVANAAFCSSCGSRVGNPPAPNQPPRQNIYAPPAPRMVQTPAPAPVYPPSGAEETLMVLQTSCRLSMAHSVICNVVFKRNWLVLAYQTDRLTMLESARLQESLKAQNLGVMKRSSAQMRFWRDFNKRYFSMSTDAILAEEPTNRALNYGSIAEIDFSCGYSTTDEDSVSEVDGTLRLTLSTGEVVKFTHQLRHDKDTKELLTTLFGTRLRYKK